MAAHSATILHVNDNEAARYPTTRLLQQAGFRVLEAGTGAEALALLDKETDLVLLDVHLPDIHGFELCRQLRELSAPGWLPILHLSAVFVENRDVTQGLESGADAYLVQPVENEVLLATIRAFLRAARERAARLDAETMSGDLEQQKRLLEDAYQSAQRMGSQLQRLAAASVEINRGLDLPTVLQSVTEHARGIIGAHQAITSLFQGEDWSQATHSVSLSDKYAAWREYAAPPDGSGIYTLVSRENRAMRMTQAELEAHPAWRGFGKEAERHPPMRGWLAVPLHHHDGRNAGMIQLSDKHEGEFTEHDEAILIQLAQLASGAMENAVLYEQVQRELAQRSRAEALREGRNRILEMIATAQPLETVLEAAACLIEQFAPRLLCSILLLDEDGKRLRHGAGPSLPLSYRESIEALEIGPSVGSCGTAAFRGETVVAADIASDPLWRDYRDLALRHELGACWSTPIWGVEGKVAGTFALYLREPGALTREEVSLVDNLVHLVGIAISREQEATALRRSEQHVRRLLDTANEGVWTLDVEGRVTYANQRLAEMLQYQAAEMPGRPLYDFLYPEDHERARAMQARRKQGADERFDFRLRRKDGEEVWCIMHASAIQAPDGVFQGTLGMLADVTERKRAEQALQESERLFRTIFDSAAIGMAVIDLEGRAGQVNLALERMLGYPASELCSTAFTRFTHPQDLEQELPLFRELAAGAREHYQIEKRFFHKEGRVLWGYVTVSLVRDVHGAPAFMIGMVEDITERRQAQEDLDRLFASSLDILGIAGLDGFFKRINPAFEKTLGYTAEDLLTQPFLEFVHPEDRAATVAEVEKLGSGIPTIYFENRYRCKDGSYKWLAWNSVPNVEAGLIYAVGRDMTPLKQSEEALQKAHEQLLQAQKMEAVGRLAGGIAHDFNNMLAVINGYSELLLTGLTPGHRMQAPLLEVRKAGEKAANLTRQLLALSRKQILEPKVVHLNSVVAELDRMLRRLIGEDIELVTLLGPATGYVKADPGQLEQVLLNLCINARDAMPEGGRLVVQTETEIREEDGAAETDELPPGPYAVITVTDTGSGMDAETLTHLFEPFFTTKPVGQGTGLGLATVFGIVKQSGGHVTVESAVGAGSSFRIYLPQVAAEALVEPSPPRRLPSGAGTVLLCEDEAMVRNMVQSILETCGYTVLAAMEANEALQIARDYAGAIDLLLTDLVMPGISGRQLAERLAEIRPEARVLYMSGYTDDAVLRHGLMSETVAFIQKPFTPAALGDKVQETLQSREGRCGSVLIVDDEADHRESLAGVLEAEGYAVKQATNGLEALEWLRAGSRPDVILLDLMMPGMNGWVFRMEQQKDPELAGIPLVVLSAVHDPASAAQYLDAAGNLTKPVDMDKLVRLVESLCAASPG